MPSRSNLSVRERELRSRLKLLLSNADGFIHGSLIEMARKCGKPSCACARDDDRKHRSRYLGQTRDSKTSMTYLPERLEPRARQAIEHFRQAQALLEEINVEARLRLDKAKAASAPQKKSSRNKAAAKKTQPKPPKRS
jgi:hypothetical protein